MRYSNTGKSKENGVVYIPKFVVEKILALLNLDQEN